MFNDAGDALDFSIDAIEHAMDGEFGEAGASAGNAMDKIPDAIGDIAGTIPEMAMGTTGEIIEAIDEIGFEVVEGVGEVGGFFDDDNR